MSLEVFLSGLTRTIVEIIKVSWWVLLPLGLFYIWNEWWVWGKGRLWKIAQKWVVLEIKVPRNIEKSPKAMENVFSALHAVRHKGDLSWEDIYFKGESLGWFSCELVGYQGEVHFYIRVMKGFRNLAESAIYSEYPDSEIIEVEDYVNEMPDVVPNEIYTLEGWDFILTKPSSYPIKTYEFFEAPAPEKRLDPIAAITEVMSRLKEGEVIWLQYLIRPVGDQWKEEGEKIRDEIMQRKREKKPTWLNSLIVGFFHFLKNLFIAAAEHPSWPEQEKKEKEFKMMEFLSPGEREDLEAIENKISKLGFETAIRFVYIDRRDSFTMQNVAGVLGAFRQFNTQNLNAFGKLRSTATYITSRKLTYKGIGRERRMNFRRRLLYVMYKLRLFPPKFFIFNAEELATVFHFPILTVKAPLLRRLETRKGEPPAGLPIEE